MAVRAALTVADVLRSVGLDPPPRDRGPCPIHRGDGRTAWSITRDGRRWACWSRCGSGDALDLAQRLLGVPFRGALEHCAALVGIAPERRSGHDVARAIARRDLERREREAAERAWRARHADALDELRDAQRDVVVVGAFLRDDPEERDPRTTALLDEIGDPYLREQVAEQRLDVLERRWRASR